MLNLVNVSSLERSTFDRLLNESIITTTQKVSDNMYNTLKLCNIATYTIDNYIVGLTCYSFLTRNNKQYLHQRFAIYGCDINNSKSWWFTEDFQRITAQFISNIECSGIITNPGTKFSDVIKTHIGSFNKYLCAPVEYDIEDIFGPGSSIMLPGGKCLVIDLMGEDA